MASFSIDKNTFDLSVKNPNKKEEAFLRESGEIIKEMKKLDKESEDILKSIENILM